MARQNGIRLNQQFIVGEPQNSPAIPPQTSLGLQRGFHLPEAADLQSGKYGRDATSKMRIRKLSNTKSQNKLSNAGSLL